MAVASAFLSLVWSVAMWMNPPTSSLDSWANHPVMWLVSAVTLANRFASPPLLLWGLWLTWEARDRGRPGETP
ncbi:hypothetical protein [Alienimonas sp. DA493]|uniref:hypothetical protein n=1 Tax=Alienimonas sp. DA493 TaxID=3373605 RepID=UPI0037552F77